MQPKDITCSLTDGSRARPRVMVLGSDRNPLVARQAETLRGSIEQFAEVVAWDIGFNQSLAEVDSDLAIVLGGDGSILRAAYHMGYRQRPIVGVNLGKLGFLADLSPEQLLSVLPDICGGKFRVVEHLMYECSLQRGEQQLWTELGLNEVAVLGGPPFSMLAVHLYVDAELVTTYSCDGLIVSTPVGSTAHSLSAGGPILHKTLHAFVVSPISPHTLTNRPVVDSADRVYELVVPEPNEGTTVVLDGRERGTLEAGDRLRISQAAPRFKLVEVPGHTYYRTLREKLGWGGSLPNHRRA